MTLAPAAPLGFDWTTEVLLLLPTPLALVANRGETHEWARIVTFAICGAIAGLFLLLGLWISLPAALLRPQGASSLLAGGAVLVAAGGLLLALMFPGLRQGVARLLPLDPQNPVHVLALYLTVAVAGFQLWAQIGANALASAGSGPAVGRLDLVAQELPLLLAAVIGVGLFTRRSPGRVAARLGWRVPTWWQAALALAAAGAFFVVAGGIDVLGHRLTPSLAHQVDITDQHLLGGLADPSGIATVALGAGICEEALFRGALQPRLGIVWVAVVFALVHTQYGLSFDSLAVLVLGFGLGLIRHFLNTTSSTITHVAYNVLAGTGIANALVPLAVGLELVLVGAAAAGAGLEIRRHRARHPPLAATAGRD